ncbi:hypothetical protein O1R50_20105 [Glycomyces luteolus]|uniref:Uncharacterized protein n=1 Tax=Glycomyces luteolus TaxID=2670330 RepID=A0A9X3PBE3_9ACTN|nr:hypothetical protein [Glycomyces luteolus]MDA1361942.1 hypothetical protein [Glycomyces luteolus]
MRRRTIAAASAAAVAITVGGFTSSASAGMRSTDVPKVSNSFGPGGEVHFDVEPANLVISEYSTGRGIEWEMWGPEAAVGTGDLYGTWVEGEYYEDVTIILFAPDDGYFTEYAVTGDFEAPQYPQDKTRGFIEYPRPL